MLKQSKTYDTNYFKFKHEYLALRVSQSNWRVSARRVASGADPQQLSIFC